ncbi:putative signal peptide-containing protein [Cryptosporidium canis]|uniref:Signal peptide-containing protein n=1 Tax=Cryptosporidium canis TaxID=195482 RepID=A0A9D5DLK4_9CRYT|nr:putative signal peptide-containing protein [Cryptosporidium canis]
MLKLTTLCLLLFLTPLSRAVGHELSASSVFESSDGSVDPSADLDMLDFGPGQPLGDGSLAVQGRVSLQDPPESSTVASMIGRESEYEVREGEESYLGELLGPPRRTRRSQELFSIPKILSKYSREEATVLNQYFLAFTLLTMKGIRRVFSRKFSPSQIRSKFASRFAKKFGGSKSKALLKLRDFERRLSLKYSAARKLFASQFQLLTSTLHSAESLIHLSQKWRYQPTHVSEPVLVVNKASYNKLRSLCRKKSKHVNIVLVSASPELVPRKYRKPDLNESHQNLKNFGEVLRSFQESTDSGKTDCKWTPPGKNGKKKRSKLSCFFKSRKQSVLHIHYYDVSNTETFKFLMLSLVRYKPKPRAQSAPPLIIVPVLIGIPQIDRQGSILGLSSITELTTRRRLFKSPSSKKKRKK